MASLWLTSGQAFGQEKPFPTRELDSVFITEIKPSFAYTSRNITAITGTELKERGALTLSDGLATLPGVSQLTTGAISKPVIRGMYGNRIQINVAGLRLEDQQWEDEHGLGLSDVGVERVELIKGPSALLFGSDAMGGVVNVIESPLTGPAGLRQTANLKFFTNTLGTGIDYGITQRKTNQAWMIHLGLESHGDYSDGQGVRVPNTRFTLLNFKLGYYFQKGRWTSENRLLSSYNQFGFIADTADIDEFETEPRWNRKFTGANHSVLFGVFSSKNVFRWNESTTLQVLVGAQANHRMEQERSNRTDLNLWLNTASVNAFIRKQLPSRWSFTAGLSSMGQTNINYGGRIIVPDARIVEGAGYGFVQKAWSKGKVGGNFEAGLRYDRRQITTLQTRQFNAPGTAVLPFSKPFEEVNAGLGQSLLVGNWLIKADLATGFRAGNLAELSANGLHEGTPNWYIGDPNLKMEHCLNADISATWSWKSFNVHASIFRNRFFDYIYLSPTGEEQFGFPVFRFRQDNATLQGFEAGILWEKEDLIEISADYSYLRSTRDDGSWLPFTPANRLLLNGRYTLPMEVFGKKPFLSLGANYVSAQNHPAEFELASPAYWLMNAGAGITLRRVRLLLSGRNLTNTVYNDHLSRLRLYGLRDMGRTIALNLSWQI